MNIQIGVDMVDISRLEKALESPHFMKRCFTAAEGAYCQQNPQRLGGHFAAKEAVAKAMHTGFRGFSPRDIEVIHVGGVPVIRLHQEAKQIGIRLQIKKIHISISHEQTMAIAMVVIECREDEGNVCK